MSLYDKLSKRSHVFQRTTGISVLEFDTILKKLKPLWRKHIDKRKQKSGRPYGLGKLENHLLCLLFYYRTYSTMLFLGFWFKVDDATICRSIKRLEPLLAKVVAIKKERKLKQEDLERILIDCTEQAIERPKHKQKKYYSGKKKRHTLKTEIQINVQGRIINVSATFPGSVHDFEVRKQQAPLPEDADVLGDSGYQGLQKVHKKAVIPRKKQKNKPLTKEDKVYNKALSQIRIKVENKIRELKIFRIIKDIYRNKRRRYSIKFNIIAGITNLRAGF